MAHPSSRWPGVLARLFSSSIIPLVLALSAALPVRAQAPVPVAATPSQGDFAGLVDVGGRGLYLECRGAGSPTVVLEAGYGNRADVWSVDLDPRQGSRQMVFPAVAAFTRVCAYDRPGTTGQVVDDHSSPDLAGSFLPSRSDPVPMPRTAADIVADLHLLLGAAGIPGPYVLVGHSLGGLTVRLYASLYPDEVGGLVLVDASQEDTEAQVRALLSPARWEELQQMQQAPLARYPEYELVDFDASSEQMRQARVAAPLRPMPLAVLSRGTSEDAPFPDWPVEAFMQLWEAQQRELAALVPAARHVVASQSGHYVQQEQPELVTEAIRQVVAGVREPATWYDLVSCCGR